MEYYLFTVDMYIPPLFTDGVNYSVVDLTNGFFGEVSSKNNLLLTENAQKITGTLHENGSEFWVVTHGFGASKGDSFYTYLVSDSGLVTNPVVSKVGYTHQGNENNAAGYISTSQLALQYSKGQHVVDVWTKTSPKVRHHILAKQDTISLLVANKHSNKWTIMYSPKIETIVDVDNVSVKEVLVAMAANSCANIQPIKTSVSNLVSDFTG